MTGKQAFSFYNRKNGQSVRLGLKDAKPQGMTSKQSLAYYQSLEAEELFEVKEPHLPLPEGARRFESYECECCGELTGTNWIRLFEGKKVCIDCYKSYDRLKV